MAFGLYLRMLDIIYLKIQRLWDSGGEVTMNYLFYLSKRESGRKYVKILVK